VISLFKDVNIHLDEKFSLQQQEMDQRYRNVFGSAEGRKVLGDILLTCHIGVPLTTEEQRYEHNIGIYIARRSGIMSGIDAMTRED
jgi:hypothetical protein